MDHLNKNPIAYMSDYVPDTGLERFQEIIELKYNVKFGAYRDLHKWTVENYTKFWEELWYFLGVIYSEPHKEVFTKTGPGFHDNEWFRGAKLNYAENLLRVRDDRAALIYLDELGNEETITFKEMFEEVKLYAAAFRKNGLNIGDRVACFMSNRMEAVLAMLAVASIGAIWGGPLPFYGAQAASNIVKMLDPKFLITIDSHQNNGIVFPLIEYIPEIVEKAQTIEKVILIATKNETRQKDLSNIRNCIFLEDFLCDGRTQDGRVPDIVFQQLPFDHPLNINFSSGTTGLPKASVHSAGTFMTVLQDYVISYNVKDGDVVCLNYPVGWNLWEYFVPSLALGATIVLNSSNAYYNHNGKNVWDIMAKYRVSMTHFVTNAVDNLEKKEIVPRPDTNLDCLKMILIGSSPVKKNNFEYIKKAVKSDVCVIITYGTTEIYQKLSGFNFNIPAYAGEIQIPALGIDIQCFDSEGKSVTGQRGEVVVCTPAPSLPIGLWKDKDKKRLTEIYLTKYPGVWSQHDECWFNPETNGFVVIGRSDDTLKQRGERFGSGDIYSAIHGMLELQDYICVGQRKSNGDSRAILFVKLQKGYKMTSLVRAKIASKIGDELWEDCVPELILEVPEIPYNLNNKRMESVVRMIVQTNKIPDVTSIKNSDSLKHYVNIPEIISYNHHLKSSDFAY